MGRAASWRVGAGTGIGLLALVGCGEPAELALPELTLTSERTRIGIGDGLHTPCAGDLSALDAHVYELESLVGFRGPESVDAYLVMDVFEACGEREGVVGCYRQDIESVFGMWDLVKHELAHAVGRDLDYPNAFLLEGFAEVGGGGTTRKSVLPLTVSEYEQDHEDLVNYVSLGHFSRFLVETRGWDTFVEFADGGDVEAVVGMTLEALIAEYERDAPAAYPPRNPCPYPSLEAADDGWEERFAFSCASEDATQYEFADWSGTSGAAIWRSVDLEAGTYEVELEGGEEVVLLGCHTEVLDELPEVPSNGDLLNEVDYGMGNGFPAGQVHELTVTAGMYRVAVSSGTESMASMTLRLRRVAE